MKYSTGYEKVITFSLLFQRFSILQVFWEDSGSLGDVADVPPFCKRRRWTLLEPFSLICICNTCFFSTACYLKCSSSFWEGICAVNSAWDELFKTFNPVTGKSYEFLFAFHPWIAYKIRNPKCRNNEIYIILST